MSTFPNLGQSNSVLWELISEWECIRWKIVGSELREGDSAIIESVNFYLWDHWLVQLIVPEAGLFSSSFHLWTIKNPSIASLFLLKVESVWITYLQTTWTHTKVQSSWNAQVKIDYIWHCMSLVSKYFQVHFPQIISLSLEKNGH